MGGKPVHWLQRELKLRCKQRRKFVATANSTHALPGAESMPDQRFAPMRPSEVAVKYITCMRVACQRTFRLSKI